jgi:PKD repeat protein
MLFFSGLSTCYAQQWDVYTTSNSGLPDNLIGLPELLAQKRSVMADRNNNIWMLLGNSPISHLVKFNTVSNEWKIFNLADAPFAAGGGESFFSIYTDSKNIVWVSTVHTVTPGDDNFYRYDGVQWTWAFSAGTLDFGEDNNGKMWATGSHAGVITLVQSDGQTMVDKSFDMNGKKVPSGSIILYDLDFDNSNNFWSAYWQVTSPRHCGLVKYREGFLPVQYVSGNFLSALEIQDDDDVWVGTAPSPVSGIGPASGIARLNGTGWDSYHTANSPLPNDTIYVLKSDAVGRLWIATANGLARFDEMNEWKVFTTDNSPLLSDVITGIDIDTVGNKWIGTSNGLVRFNEITPAFSHQNLCFGSIEFQDQSVSMEGSIKAWHWDFAGLGTSAKPDPSFTFLAPGEYNVRLWIKDERGNRNMIFQKVTITAETPDLNLRADVQPCQASVVIVSDFNSASQYTWHTPSGITQGGSTLTATRTGEYILEAKMQDGCVLRDTVDVIVNELTGAEFSVTSAGRILANGDAILKGIPIQCVPNTTQQGLTWSFGDNTISPEEAPVHTYEHAGTYTITLTGTNTTGCEEKKVIEVQDIFITTAISPNGDGKNDKLYVEPFVYEASLKVIDQRGRTVFDAASYRDDFTGKELEEGVYYYELHFKEVDKRYKGYVQIIK